MFKTFAKKECILLVFSILSILLVACGKANNPDNRGTTENEIQKLFTTEEIVGSEYVFTTSDNTSTEVVTIEMTEYENPALNPDNPDYEEPIGVADENVDVDLSVLTPNMVFSMIFDMQGNYSEYDGKIVKIKGNYMSYYDENTDNTYHYVMVSDKTACCKQGLEFIWDEGKHVFPDDYPKEDEVVQVTGIYSVYSEEVNGVEKQYYYIKTDNIERIE